MANPLQSVLPRVRSAWGEVMADIRDEIAPRNGRYPQINLNTGISAGAFVLLLGMVVWSVTIKNTVDYHTDRLSIAEGTIKELRASIDTVRFGQAQAETKLEGRLVGIEVLLREVINRLPAERDRRTP